jgi:hypothetical protein
MEVWLNNNALEELPAALGQLGGLRVLCVSGNKLTALPAELGRLTRLERLYAQRNQLVELPAGVLEGSGGALRELDLSHNRLTALPWAALGVARGLEVLGLAHNCIADTTPPEGTRVRRLRQLQSLDLEGNQLGPSWGPHAALAALAPNIWSLAVHGNGLGPGCVGEIWASFPALQRLRVAERGFVRRPLDLSSGLYAVSGEGGRATEAEVAAMLHAVIVKRKARAEAYDV